MRTNEQNAEPLTFLCQQRVRLVLVHQQLNLFWFEGRVEDLVQTRVALLIVDELRHLLQREVRSTFSPAVERTEGVRGNTTTTTTTNKVRQNINCITNLKN